eukprot:TRINITY_DN16352_c0_g2_i1.p1 TRINITY_DN16352_c0_g2~~TRINITY_DN16352_c0_g2_i1.p1  ORF type:complete len:254 (-),score=69.29 TRINITY_DN16352_c0_g2_i1:101-862(-)
MISCVVWVVMMILYVVIYLAADQMKTFASDRCGQEALCTTYGTASSCTSICKIQVANQLIGEVVLLTLIFLAGSLFVLNYMNILYKKILLFDEHFPNAFSRDDVEEELAENKEQEVVPTADDQDTKAEQDAPYLKVAPARKFEEDEFGALDEKKDMRSESFSYFSKTPRTDVSTLTRPAGPSQTAATPPAPGPESPAGIVKSCALDGCDQPAFDLQCPLCHQSASPPPDSFFCCQEHFDRAWKTTHKAKYHKK